MPATAQGDVLLNKTLRDGRQVELRIIPQSDNPGTLAYWLVIHWPGQSGRTFGTKPYQPEKAPAPGVTHAIHLPGPDGEWVNLGLTGAEAARINAGVSAWVQPRQDRKDAERATAEAAARNAVPDARTWTVPDAYGYLAAIGQPARLHDGTAATALAHASAFYKEDGYSYGAAEDAGWVYFTEVREATPAEAAELEAREAKAAARGALAAQGAALASDIDAETPEEVPAGIGDLPGARIEPERSLSLAFGAESCYRHLRADAASGWLWVLTWNGADGDNWSLSNSGSYVARRLPLTPERRELFDGLAAEFGAIEARNA